MVRLKSEAFIYSVFVIVILVLYEAQSVYMQSMPMLGDLHAPRKFLKLDALRLHFRTLLMQLKQIQTLKEISQLN